MKRISCILLLASALAACGPAADAGPVNIAVIGDEASLFQDGVRLSMGAQHLRAATGEGLVTLDETGEVIPAVAERWIVTDDGLSYIFRLREATWPDGEPISAAAVQELLQDTLGQLEGTSLGLDLAKIKEIRAMTGRVVEFRLTGPMPEFLRLLAQPEMGIIEDGKGSGPMRLELDDAMPMARLTSLPPQDRGLPVQPDWESDTRGLVVEALPGQEAIDAFFSGEVDLLLNGTIATFPMVELGPLSRGTVQVDPTMGLFGLIILSDEGVLEDPSRREALSMAIDRSDLIQPFGLGGWTETTWIVPPDRFSPLQYPASRWNQLSLEERREVALRRIVSWETEAEEEAVLRVGLPPGPGGDLLFQQLSRAWQSIGVATTRVALGEPADLELRDRIARYSSPRWYLNQLNCSLEIGLCSPEADELVQESLALRDAVEKQALLADAHLELVAAEVFIPLGVPVRWSLVRGAVNGYEANPWGLHHLFPLSQPTN